MAEMLIIQTTSEKLREEILQDFKKEIASLKKEYQPKQPSEYLTRHEVAKILKVDLSTIHNWTKQSKLKPYGIGSRVYFKRDEVEQSLINLKR